MTAERLTTQDAISDRERAIKVYFKAGFLVTQFGEKGEDSTGVSGQIPQEQDIRGFSDFSISFLENTGEIWIKNEQKEDEHKGKLGIAVISGDGAVRTRLLDVEYVDRGVKNKKHGSHGTYKTFVRLASALSPDTLNFKEMELFLEKAEAALRQRKAEDEYPVEKPSGILGKIFGAKAIVRNRVLRN